LRPRESGRIYARFDMVHVLSMEIASNVRLKGEWRSQEFNVLFYSKKKKDTMAPVKSDTKNSNDSAKNALISQPKITDFSPMITNFLWNNKR
jgi:hypothetical protein